MLAGVTKEQTLADVLNEPFTLKNLILKDKLVMERKSLKDIILELEDEILANAGVNVFEEVFKLITTTEKFVRDFVVAQARILAVVGLHANTFKPDTSIKTSVLFLQKWNNDPEAGPLCPRVEDYPTFLASSEQSGKDNAGNYIYLATHNGSPIVEHDLHNHDGELPDGIAEAFIEWAQCEGLSFWS